MKCDVNAKNKVGRTPLMFAAKYGAELAHYLSQKTLRILMASWFCIISTYMFLV